MTQLVLSVPTKKVKSFLSLIHNLDYVKVENTEFTVPVWQKKEVQKRIKSIKAKPGQLVTSRESFRRLKSLRV